MKYAIGVDIGGTKTSMVLGTQKGEILSRIEIPTLKHKRASQGVRNLKTSIRQLIEDAGITKKDLCGIGVGIPGAVNSAKGVVPLSPNMQGWKGIPLESILRKEFKVPVVLANDANVAILAESLFGQARKAKQALYLTVSTGVGGGVMVNGELVEGHRYVAGELGHMTVLAGGPRCKCGQQGCLEILASGTAIGKYVENAIRAKKGKGIQRIMGKSTGLGGRDVGIAAKQRHPVALAAYKEAGYYLGVGVGSLLNIFNPEVVVLGGGVFKSAPKDHWNAFTKSLKQHSWPEARVKTKIVRSKLGDDIGNLGAMALVFSKSKRK